MNVLCHIKTCMVLDGMVVAVIGNGWVGNNETLWNRQE